MNRSADWNDADAIEAARAEAAAASALPPIPPEIAAKRNQPITDCLREAAGVLERIEREWTRMTPTLKRDVRASRISIGNEIAHAPGKPGARGP